MMLTVYGRATSSNVQALLWGMEELGLSYTRLDYGEVYGGLDSAEFQALTPHGKIPVLKAGDQTIWETPAILRYLAANYGGDDFWPSDAAQRASLDAWAEWGKNTFTEAVLEIFVYDVRLSPETRDPAILENAAQKLSVLAQLLDERLGDGPYLAGNQLTFADMACGHILYRYYNLDWPRPDLPQLKSYYEEPKLREAYSENVMISYEDLRGSY